MEKEIEKLKNENILLKKQLNNNISNISEEERSKLSLVDPENMNVFENYGLPYLVNIFKKNEKLLIKKPKVFADEKENQLLRTSDDFFSLNLNILPSNENNKGYLENIDALIGIAKEQLHDSENIFNKEALKHENYKEFSKDIFELINDFIKNYIDSKLKNLNSIYENYENNEENAKNNIKKVFEEMLDTLIKNISVNLNVNLYDLFSMNEYLFNNNEFNNNLNNLKNMYNFTELVNKEHEAFNIDSINHQMKKIINFVVSPILKNAKNIDQAIYKIFNEKINNYYKNLKENETSFFLESFEEEFLNVLNKFSERKAKNYNIEIILDENQLNDSMRNFPLETSVFLSQILILSKIFNVILSIPDEKELKIFEKKDGLFDSNGYILTYYNLNKIKDLFKNKHQEILKYIIEFSKDLNKENKYFFDYNKQNKITLKGGLNAANMQLAALLSSKMVMYDNEIQFIDDNILVEFWLTNFNDLGNFKKDNKFYSANIGDIAKSNINVENIHNKNHFLKELFTNAKKVLNKDLSEFLKAKKNNKSNFFIEKESVKKEEKTNLPNNVHHFKSYTVVNTIKNQNKIINSLKNFFNIESIEKLQVKNTTYNDEHYNFGILNNLNFKFIITKIIKDDNIQLNDEFIDLISGLYEIEEISMDNLNDKLSPLMVIAGLNSPLLTDLKLGLLNLNSVETLTNEYLKYKDYILANKGTLNNSINNIELSFTEDISNENFKKFFKDFVLDLAFRSRIETKENILINLKFTNKNSINKDKVTSIFKDIITNNNLLNVGNKLKTPEFDNKITIKVFDTNNTLSNKKEYFNKDYNTIVKVF